MKKSFLVVYEKGRKNYGGFAPDVPGCGGLGYTLKGVRADLRAGIKLYMDTCLELEKPLPEPTNNTVTLPMEGETNPKVSYYVERLTIKIPKMKNSKLKMSKRAIAKRRALQTA